MIKVKLRKKFRSNDEKKLKEKSIIHNNFFTKENKCWSVGREVKRG